MKTEILCVGVGGQGVLTIGLIISNACILSDKDVTWYPKYGAAMRGGLSSCHVKISDEEVYAPVIKKADVLFALNNDAVDAYMSMLKPGGSLFVDSDIVGSGREYRKDINVYEIPVETISKEVGNPKGANLVILGAFVKATGTFGYDEFVANIEDFFAKKGKSNPKNFDSFKAGYDFVK